MEPRIPTNLSLLASFSWRGNLVFKANIPLISPRLNSGATSIQTSLKGGSKETPLERGLGWISPWFQSGAMDIFNLPRSLHPNPAPFAEFILNRVKDPGQAP